MSGSMAHQLPAPVAFAVVPQDRNAYHYRLEKCAAAASIRASALPIAAAKAGLP
jgi:hypothetical protein